MKKLLLFLGLIAGISTLNADSKNYAEFKKWAEGVQTDWFRWEGKLLQDKYNMRADHAAEWFKFGQDQIAAINGLKELKDRDAFFQKQLENAVDLYESQEEEISKFFENKHAEARSKSEIFKKQLKELKVKIGLEKPEAAKEESTTQQNKPEEGATKPATVTAETPSTTETQEAVDSEETE